MPNRMKFSFERTGTYSWAMGNSCTEDGSFFVIDPGVSSVLDCIPIWRNYGMCYISAGDRGVVGYLSKSNKDYLFVPEQAYPLIDLMTKDIQKLDDKRQSIFKTQDKNKSAEKLKQLEKIKSFIDITSPIEVH